MAKSTAIIRPLDAAELDAVLRSRLSHLLSHRPLMALRNRIAPVLKAVAKGTEEGGSDEFAYARLALLPDLQSYLLALHRTRLTSTQTSASQLAQYEEQLKKIKQEEADCKQRIAGLKRDLEGVRKRRREKVEFGRVVEGVEAWFKSNGPAGNEIEDSLSTLLSHLTSSFLYQPPATANSSEDVAKNQEAESSAQAHVRSTHTETLSLLHSKLETMLIIAREVREIVGWKPGTGGGSAQQAAPAAAAAAAAALSGPCGSASGSRAASVQGSLNPTAKPFKPSNEATFSSRDSGYIPSKRDQKGLQAGLFPSSGSSLTDLTSSELEEGEEGAVPTGALGSSLASSKRRKVLALADGNEGEGSGPSAAAANLSSASSLKADDDDNEEEGSIAPPQTALGSVAGSNLRPSARSTRAVRGVGLVNTRSLSSGVSRREQQPR